MNGFKRPVMLVCALMVAWAAAEAPLAVAVRDRVAEMVADQLPAASAI